MIDPLYVAARCVQAFNGRAPVPAADWFPVVVTQAAGRPWPSREYRE